MYGLAIPKSAELSYYQPSKEVCALTKDFKEAWGKGYNILHKTYEELNFYTPIDRENKDQRTWNSFVDEDIDDPMEAWKWRGTRSMARDKAIDMHAHMTAVLAVPKAFAQNDKQEEDRQMSAAMGDTLEWMAVNSEYRESYVNVMMGVLYSPVKWLGAEWVEATIKTKSIDDEGNYSTREVLDKELSGFRAPIYSVDQVLITNAYEQNVQRQYIVIKREYKPYTDVARNWDWHDNWPYVSPGIKTIYNEEDGLFYNIKDDEHTGLVEFATGWCRQTDTEVVFINGIYMGDADTEHNAIKHRDNFNQPKVPLVPFGYERINEHYFFWKSLMNRVGWDNSLLDAMYENTMNRESLDLYAPMGIYGVEDFSTSVMFPGAVVSFEDPQARAEPLVTRNPGAGYSAMEKIEKSITDKTVSDTMGGNEPEATQKAYNVQRAEQNARTILKGAFRSISFSIIRYGDLMKDIAIQHLTTAEWDEITGGEQYRTLLLRDQMVDGKQVSKRLVFDDGLVGKQMSKEEVKEASLNLLSETNWPKNKEHVYRINPHMFSKLPYMIRIEPDDMIEKNSAFITMMAERMYALLRNDPLVAGEGLVRKVLNANFRGEADDLMKDPETVLPGMSPEGAKVNLHQTIRAPQPSG